MKNNKKGFTLAELLIVVAIIAVLVAVAIPVFTTQLERSRDAVTVSNIRSAYAMAQTAYLTGQDDDANKVKVTKNASGVITSIEVEGVISKGTQTGWSNTTDDLVIADKLGTSCDAMGETPKDGGYKLTFSYDGDGKITAVAAA